MIPSFDLEYESDKMKFYQVFFKGCFWVSSCESTNKHSLEITRLSMDYFACAQFCDLILVEHCFVCIALQIYIISAFFSFWIST